MITGEPPAEYSGSSGGGSSGQAPDPQQTYVNVRPKKQLRGILRVISDWFHGRVALYTLTYDPDADAYTLDYDTLKKNQIPKEALAVTGEGDKVFFLDRVHGSLTAAPMHCNATDLYCWYKNNDLDEAVTSQHKNVPISNRTIVWIGVGIVALVLMAVLYL